MMTTSWKDQEKQRGMHIAQVFRKFFVPDTTQYLVEGNRTGLGATHEDLAISHRGAERLWPRVPWWLLSGSFVKTHWILTDD